MGSYFERTHRHPADRSDGSEPIQYSDLIDPPAIPTVPTTYGIVSTITAGVAAAGRVVIGAGTGAMVLDPVTGRTEWAYLAAEVTIDETASAATKYPYLSLSAGAASAYLSATAPVFDAAAGYWTDGAGGRWIGAVLTKSGASTFRSLTVAGVGANMARSVFGVAVYARAPGAISAATWTECGGLATYAQGGALVAAGVEPVIFITATGRQAVSFSPTNSGGNNTLASYTGYSTGAITHGSNFELPTAFTTLWVYSEMAGGAASYVRLARVTHQF